MFVRVAVGVVVGVCVTVMVGVFVGDSLGVVVCVIVGVCVAVDVAVAVGVIVGVALGVEVGVIVGVFVGVPVAVLVGVVVGVFVGVAVGVMVGVAVAVGVRVGNPQLFVAHELPDPPLKLPPKDPPHAALQPALHWVVPLEVSTQKEQPLHVQQPEAQACRGPKEAKTATRPTTKTAARTIVQAEENAPAWRLRSPLRAPLSATFPLLVIAGFDLQG